MNEKRSYDDILFILAFLSKKRVDLISPFLDKSVEWIGPTFKYERNQPAFNLVREKFRTLWVDSHFQEFLNEDVNDDVKHNCLKIMSYLLYDEKATLGDAKFTHELLSNKIMILSELLTSEDIRTANLNEFKFSYDKDKALFEREFAKYEKEL